MSSIFRSSNPLHELPSSSRGLVIANTLVFFVQMIFPEMGRWLALHAPGGVEPFYPWQLVTYSFLHGNGFHLLINMFVLWMVGAPVENFLGKNRFLVYYFTCVVGAGLTHLFFAPGEVAVGASGGIYGVLLAFGILFPDAVIYLLFIFPMKAIHAILFLMLITLASAASSGGSRIAHFAHLGGLLTGYLFFKIPSWYHTLAWRIKMGLPKRSRKKPEFHVVGGKSDLQAEVDRILEKISQKGIASLTEDEHKTMQRYAKQQK